MGQSCLVLSALMLCVYLEATAQRDTVRRPEKGTSCEPRKLLSDAPGAGGAKFEIFRLNFFYLNLSRPLAAATLHVYDVVMSTIYSYDEFLIFVGQEHNELRVKDPTVRLGQTYFNCLWEFRPSIANQIRATKYDPFHKDDVHPEIHGYVSALWDEMNSKVMSGE